MLGVHMLCYRCLSAAVEAGIRQATVGAAGEGR